MMDEKICSQIHNAFVDPFLRWYGSPDDRNSDFFLFCTVSLVREKS